MAFSRKRIVIMGLVAAVAAAALVVAEAVVVVTNARQSTCS